MRTYILNWLPETPQNTNFVEWGHSAPEMGENTNFLGDEFTGSACVPGEGREAVLNVYHATYLYAESQLDAGGRGVEGELNSPYPTSLGCVES